MHTYRHAKQQRIFVPFLGRSNAEIVSKVKQQQQHVN